MAPTKKRKKPRNFLAVCKETMIKHYGCSIAEECENRISSRMKRDLLGFADLIALSETEVFLVQFTSDINFNARKYKIQANENAKFIVDNGLFRVLAIGFRDVKLHDNYKLHEFTPSDFGVKVK